MISIIAPTDFKQIPWKNGKGTTTELAINSGGTLQRFTWRLSIASVSENGPFSDFSGYLRHLILLDGNGIQLTHNEATIDRLVEPLSMARFSGAAQTVGTLIDGPITDFNLMTRQDEFSVQVNTWSTKQVYQSDQLELAFVYSAKANVLLNTSNQPTVTLPPNHLAIIEQTNSDELQIRGSHVIYISLVKRK